MEPLKFLLLKDPAQVRRLGAQKDRENMELRAELKAGLCSEAGLDALFHRLNDEISAEID